MQGMNYLAIVVAAVAAFVASVVWYALFGNAMTELREADPAAAANSGTSVWTVLFVVAQSLVVAFMVAYFLSRLGMAGLARRCGVSAPGVGFPSRDPGLRRPRGHPLGVGRHPRR